MDLSAFGNPWEHIRLLSDGARNAALIDLLARHAPGKRVLEIGCGTGLLSLAAARLGASKVYAVEPTPLFELARQLVRDNNLQDIVEVHEGRVQDLEPRPVDLAFSELLNAEPFGEGVVPAMRAANAWLAPGGLLVPKQLRVWVALVRAPDSAREAQAARDEVGRLEARLNLDLGLLSEALTPSEAYKFVSQVDNPISSTALAWDITLGTDDEPMDVVEVEVVVQEPGPIAGAVIWFDADLDDEATMANPPGEGGHWGQLLCGFSEERGYRAGQSVRLRLELDHDEVEVTRLG